MARPTLPADGVKPWGTALRNAIFDISDRADNAISAAVSAGNTATSALTTANSAASTASANSSAVSQLQASLASKANDSDVVKLTGDQTVAGIKTFNNAPVVPDNSFAISKVNGLQTALNNASGGTGGGIATTDPRLSDARTPLDNSVTNVKVATAANISADKLADGTNNKILTAAERTKLAGIATGATVNATDAALRDRGTHTGTQLASTISDLTTAVVRTTLDQTISGVKTFTNGIVLPAGDLEQSNIVDLIPRFEAIEGDLNNLQAGILPVSILAANTNPPAGAPVPAWYLTPLSSTNVSSVARVGVTSVVNAATNSLNIPLPPGTQIGDVAWAYSVHSPSDGAVAPATPAPTAAYTAINGTGWVGKATQTISVSNRCEVYAKVIDSTDLTLGKLVVKTVNVQHMGGGMEVLRGLGATLDITVTLAKDATAVTSRPTPSVAITGRTLYRSIFAARYSEAATSGTFVQDNIELPQDFWKNTAGSGSVVVSMATDPAIHTDATVGGTADIWTIVTPGTTGVMTAAGYAGTIAIKAP